MTNAQRKRMYERITKHGEQLKSIFGLNDVDAVELCKKLRRLEAKAHKLAEDSCNGTEASDAEEQAGKIMKKVCAILNQKQFITSNMAPDDTWPIFLNYDARGYALKIKDAFLEERSLNLYKDWGGYGIIAPDFTE